MSYRQSWASQVGSLACSTKLPEAGSEVKISRGVCEDASAFSLSGQHLNCEFLRLYGIYILYRTAAMLLLYKKDQDPHAYWGGEVLGGGVRMANTIILLAPTQARGAGRVLSDIAIIYRCATKRATQRKAKCLSKPSVD